MSDVKITRIETIVLRRPMRIHAGEVGWLWVRLYTDQGLVGLGETYPTAESSEAVIRHQLAPLLLGRDPRQIDRLWADMKLSTESFGATGAEMRAISAVDLALWDLLGKYTGQPVYQLLGGKSRDRIRTYNTCYDHRHDFRTDAAGLARSLLDEGVNAMKIWPFDEIAVANHGQFITHAEMEEGLRPLREIREAVGDEMEVAMEFHGYWNLPSAVRIARALEPYEPMWLEEMLPQDNLASYQALRDQTSIPLILSERLMTRWQFREVLEQGLAHVVNPDISWCGGLSEAKKIATFAETYHVPIAPHNCGGPVLHVASLHLAQNAPNLLMLESVRRHYQQDYLGLVTETGAAEHGWLRAPERPGLGIELDPAVLSRADVRITG